QVWYCMCMEYQCKMHVQGDSGHIGWFISPSSYA
ncbi:unnamed protein product, partial [marine sediment metagenome]